MATKITVFLEEDLDGGPAEETVRFGIGGTDYEIDLNAKNASAFGQQLAPYYRTCPQGWQRTAVAAGADAACRARSADLRAWAKTRASRSATAAASPPASPSSIKPPAEDGGAGLTHRWPEPIPGGHWPRRPVNDARLGRPHARTCRIECVADTHTYALLGMITRGLGADLVQGRLQSGCFGCPAGPARPIPGIARLARTAPGPRCP
jgi:hypothetical protein